MLGVLPIQINMPEKMEKIILDGTMPSPLSMNL